MFSVKSGGGRDLFFRFNDPVVDGICRAMSGFADSPEKRLMAELLFDALKLILNRSFQFWAQVEAKNEAWSWIQCRDKEYLYSFENVCECLGVHPDFLRFGISNAVTSGNMGWVGSAAHLCAVL